MFFNPTQILTDVFCDQLREGYRRMFGCQRPDYAEILAWVGRMAIEILANSDALYHTPEHTMLVTLVGQEILRGKHMREGGVSCDDWLNCVVSLACHDIGYVKGVCRQDRIEEGLYALGKNGAMIPLPAGSSDASLTPYHVDRGKLFVQERFGGHLVIDAEVVQHNIELTRFPVPAAEDHQDTLSYPALVRAADLIGQLSDPRYLKKHCALFYEFEETGTSKTLGFRDPGDLRKNYARFFWQAVYPYVKDALRYLSLTQEGKQVTAQLYAHVFVVEHERHEDERLQLAGPREPVYQGQPASYWVGQLKDDDRYVRMHAAAALGQIGPHAREAVPALLESLQDNDDSIRQWAAQALEGIGKEAEEAVPALRRALNDVNAFVRIKAAAVLWKLGGQAPAVIDALVEALREDNWMVRSAAALALGKIGPEAAAAVPALSAAVKDQSSDVRKVSAEVLRKVAPHAVVPALVGALKGEDKYMRMEAALALSRLGTEAVVALPDLTGLLQDRSWMVRRAAALALGEFGPEAAPAVPALAEALQDDYELIRLAAAEALGAIGPAAGPAAAALAEAVHDKDLDVSRAAAVALKKIGWEVSPRLTPA
jgi:HEAT repeat protein